MSVYKPWREFERSITRELRGLGFDVKRLWSEQFEEKSGADILAEPFVIQAKYGKKPKLRDAYLEAVGERKKGQIAVGICRFSEEKDTLVCLSWKDFKGLIKKTKGGDKI